MVAGRVVGGSGVGVLGWVAVAVEVAGERLVDRGGQGVVGRGGSTVPRRVVR